MMLRFFMGIASLSTAKTIFWKPSGLLMSLRFSDSEGRSEVTLTARNDGERRLRISALSLRDASGKSLSFGNGLAGYALGQSTMSWTVPRHGFTPNGSISVTAQSDGGPIQAVASIGR